MDATSSNTVKKLWNLKSFKAFTNDIVVIERKPHFFGVEMNRSESWSSVDFLSAKITRRRNLSLALAFFFGHPAYFFFFSLNSSENFYTYKPADMNCLKLTADINAPPPFPMYIKTKIPRVHRCLNFENSLTWILIEDPRVNVTHLPGRLIYTTDIHGRPIWGTDIHLRW